MQKSHFVHFAFPLSPLYCFSSGYTKITNGCIIPQTLFTKKKDTAAYKITHIIIFIICFLRLPLFLYIPVIAKTAIQLQSAGNALHTKTKIMICFTILFILSSVSCNHIIKTAINSGYITLVWLNIPVLNGMTFMPNAKQYAKWDINANRNSRNIYFFTLRV